MTTLADLADLADMMPTFQDLPEDLVWSRILPSLDDRSFEKLCMEAFHENKVEFVRSFILPAISVRVQKDYMMSDFMKLELCVYLLVNMPTRDDVRNMFEYCKIPIDFDGKFWDDNNLFLSRVLYKSILRGVDIDKILFITADGAYMNMIHCALNTFARLQRVDLIERFVADYGYGFTFDFVLLNIQEKRYKVAETLLNLLKEEPSGIQCHYEEIKKLVGAIHNFDPDTWYSYYIAGQYHKIYDTMVLISWSLESKYEKAHMKQKTIKLLKYYQKILNIPDFFDACVRFRENVLYFHNDEE